MAYYYGRFSCYKLLYGIQKPCFRICIQVRSWIVKYDDFIESLPSGYNTAVGERGITLSGGQKQRIAIARIIIRNPEIIIFDDSTSNLDADTETRFLDTIKEFIAGKTTIVISHKLSSIMLAERAFVIEKGKLREEGNISDLMHKNGYFSDLFSGRFRGDSIE